MKKLSLIAAACTLLLSGCAQNFVQNYEPIVDTKGVEQNRYQADLADCRVFAYKNDPATKAANGAIAGALAGALIGAAVGGGRMAAYGAGVGAAEGGVAGGVSGVVGQQQIVKRCLANRGYSVLD